MNSMLQHIEEQIRQSDAEPGTLIHIGAGTGSELQEYLDLKFSRIVLYEAVPELAEELRERSRGHPQVSVEETVVAGQNGEVTFHRMNNPRFSSLSEQNTLKDYYPNLRSTPVQMEAESLEGVISKHDLSDDAVNVLVLEVQGAEELLVSNVKPEELQKFNWILISSVKNEVEIHENKATSARLLLKPEFTVEHQDSDGYPFFNVALRRDDNAIAVKVLNQEYKFINEDLEKKQAESERLKNELEVKKKEQEESRELIKELQDQVDEYKQLDKQVEAKTKEIEEAKALIKELRDQVIDNKELQSKLAHKEKEISEVNELNKELRQDLDENESTLRLNTKILAKTQQDLDDLREKYAAKVSSENELQELISELYEKLKMASNFYSKLQDKHPELLDKQMD